ncbi:hypothetical protein BU24DRAFT_427952 [Aaosphaeria arxii CBS 175.79]|uniref:F-box domain-containing protein n=1 Tax=Aaosphaeria arxii CBS 175.79 TaxID=1450172 RepID=A0A6A5XAP0_9PLEO|nr:uncharacterized protein BU24DRAFT_427952 [Aaosphaeria arxii CBS 175.79]KAF2009916.1 hypothetical protein BU24DRAFT_427952 [Aaosphaeria arxii CBS 175.79]
MSPTTRSSAAKAELLAATNDYPSGPSLCNLPTEIRLEIFNHLLNVSHVPSSYGYTGPARVSTRTLARPKPTTVRHGMVFVSKTLGAEYRQAYYERTRFFLRIDSQNCFTAVPALINSSSSSGGTTSPTAVAQPSGPGAHEPQQQPQQQQQYQDGVPNFWNAPLALLSSLRHCTLYIELGDIASSPRSSHSLSQVVRSHRDIFEARRVREEMKTFSSFDDLKAGDAEFDSTLMAAVQRLLDQMAQLRSIQLVWETSVPVRARFTTACATNWMWVSLGQPFVEGLRRRANLRGLQVKLGDSFGDTVYVAQRGKEGKWEGGLKDDHRR